MNRKNKLGKVAKRVLGYDIRLKRTGGGYGVYAGKHLQSKDYIPTIEKAEEFIYNYGQK